MDSKGSHGVSRRTVLGGGAVLMAGLGMAACGASKDLSGAAEGTAEGADMRSIVADAYLYGYPLVMFDATRLASSPTNQLLRLGPPMNGSRSIVAPQTTPCLRSGGLICGPSRW